MAFIDPHEDLRPVSAMAELGSSSVLIGGRVHLLASPRERAVAGFIDFACYRFVLFILSAFWLIAVLLHAAAHDGFEGTPPTIIAFYFGFTLLFFGPMTWRSGGQSVGKRFIGLRVVQSDGSPLRLRSALIRETLFRAAPLLLLLPLRTLPSPLDIALLAAGLVALRMASSRPDRQAWWDRAAGTLVVHHDPLPLRTPSLASAITNSDPTNGDKH